MSEPLRHERLGALCAPTCPGCRAAAKEQRAAERRGTLKTVTLGTLVQEIGDRFTALSTENANLRTQAQTVADKTESLRALDAKKLQDLRSQLDDLESTASEQDESLATTSETHRLIFDLVHRATGVRTEGLTVSEAVEKVTKALKDVQRMRDLALDRESLRESDLEQAREELAEARQNNAQMADAIERMRQEVVDRSRAYESETRELRDTAKKLRHQLDELRTAQAPRWYPAGSNSETTTLNNLLRGDEHKAARAYSWIDRTVTGTPGSGCRSSISGCASVGTGRTWRTRT